jgi:glycosyltransferase involved in cell wall biosynthesis
MNAGRTPLPDAPPVERTRVLRVFSRLNVGGPAVHVILLAAGLRDKGYDTRLVVGRESAREGNLLDLAREKNVECEQLSALGREIRPLADLLALWSLFRLVRRFRPHVVHTHTAKAGLLGRLAARLGGAPVVVHTFHGHVFSGYFSRRRTLFFSRLEALLAHFTDVLVTVAEDVRAELVAHGVGRPERIHVVPLGLELGPLSGPLPRGHLRAAAGFDEGAPLVGIVGRLVPIKDVPTFLRAAALLRASVPAARFAVVGDGEERPDLERLAGELGLGGLVHFFGWRRDLPAVYGDLDLVVNCSRNEGTPVALIEALAAGRPVVATAVGGTAELLGRGERGVLVPPGQPEALAAAMCGALEGGQDQERRRCAGRAYALAHHSSERLLHDVDALYREALARRTAA